MAPLADIDIILARFPGPVTLYPSRKKWLLLVVAGLLFVAVGVWQAVGGDGSAWYGVAFFALVSLVGITMLLPGAGQLTLDGAGFELLNLYRRSGARWKDVSHIDVTLPWPMLHFVAYDDASVSTQPLAKLAAAMRLHTGTLPDTYGLSADHLAALIMKWRERAVAVGAA